MLQFILEQVPEIFLTVPYWGVFNVTPYLVALGIFAFLTVFFGLLQSIVLTRLRQLSAKTVTDVDDVLIQAVDSIRPTVYTLVSLYLSLQLLPLVDWLDKFVTGVFLVVIVWQVIEVASRLIAFASRKILEKDEDGDGEVDPGSATASHMVTLLAKVALWAFGLIFVLSNLGVEVTSLVAGLGIGGIAVAFALQGILSDLFSSFSIYFDKPFRIGDFVVLGEDMGTVEKIGIKTTRIRTLQGEELVVSNAELTSTRIQNYKKMKDRRIVFNLGVTYETDKEKIKDIPEMIKTIVESVSDVRFDRAHFASYGDSALVFEVVYFVETSEYNTYMDRQQEINLAIMDKFSSEGIDFAYPTQMVYVKQ